MSPKLLRRHEEGSRRVEEYEGMDLKTVLESFANINSLGEVTIGTPESHVTIKVDAYDGMAAKICHYMLEEGVLPPEISGGDMLTIIQRMLFLVQFWYAYVPDADGDEVVRKTVSEGMDALSQLFKGGKTASD